MLAIWLIADCIPSCLTSELTYMFLPAYLDTNLMLERFKLIIQSLIVHFVTLSIIIKSTLQTIYSLLQELIRLDLLILGLSQLDIQLVQLHIHLVLRWVCIHDRASLLRLVCFLLVK